MTIKPRRVAIEKINNPAARNVCFSKRRKGLFRKASELCSLNPSVSVHSIVFSPGGKPFVFGNPELLLNRDTPHHHTDKIRSLLAVDISALDRTELECYADCLRQLKSTLVSNNGNDQNPGGFTSLSYGEMNLQSGSQFSEGVDMDFLSLSDFGVEYEFEKLRNGYEFVVGEVEGSESGLEFVSIVTDH